MTLLSHILVFVANAAGLVGAIFLVAPFFRENGLRKRLAGLMRAVTGRGGAGEVFAEAARQTKERLAKFDPADQRWIIWGLLLVALSYGLNLVVWILPTPDA